MSANRLAEILVRARLIDELQLRSALAHQAQWGGRIPAIVVEKRFAKEEAVVEALAKALGQQMAKLEILERDAAALAKIDVDYARSHAVFPMALRDGGKTLWVAMADPTDLPTLDELGMKTRLRLKTVIAGEGEILRAIERHYMGRELDAGPRAFGAIEPEIERFDDSEAAVVDLAGRTIVDSVQAAQTYSPQPSAPRQTPAVAGASPAEELQRLAALKDTHAKSTTILKAVLELCVEKGVITLDEYRKKL